MNILSGLSGDIVLAFRRLREAPVFAIICTATLAIGIGGNSAVFTLIDRVLLNRLPVPQPEELYRVGETDDCCVNSGLAELSRSSPTTSINTCERPRPSSRSSRPSRPIPAR